MQSIWICAGKSMAVPPQKSKKKANNIYGLYSANMLTKQKWKHLIDSIDIMRKVASFGKCTNMHSRDGCDGKWPKTVENKNYFRKYIVTLKLTSSTFCRFFWKTFVHLCYKWQQIYNYHRYSFTRKWIWQQINLKCCRAC